MSLILLFAGTASGSESFPFVAEDLKSPILSFEGKDLPGSLQAVGGSEVALTDRHYINGSQSLRWSWNGSSEILFERAIPFKTNQEAYDMLKRGALSVFSVWVYSETALPDAKLRVEFGVGDCGFDFGLNFTGWRTCSVSFTRDMEGTPKKGMRGLRIRSPRNVPEGKLFIDRIILASIDDIRYQWPDPQVPFVKGTGCASMEITPVPDVGVDLPEERAAVDQLEIDFEADFLLEEPIVSNEVSSILQQVDEYKIVSQDGVIRGRHVLFSRKSLRDRQDSIYPRTLTEQDEFLMDQYAELRDYTELMQRMAQIYRSLPPESEDAVRLRDAFMLMSRHLLDQGWQEGSALYTTHHFGYASRGWYSAVFLMRDELAKEGLLEPVTRSLIWYMREKVDFAKMEFDPKKGADLDYLNTVSKPHLMMVLSMPDGPVKTAMVKKISGYLSDLIAAHTRGTLGGIKADGTAFHHGGNYPGYSFPAFRSTARLCKLFNGTPFPIRADALENLNTALTAAALYCNPEIGMALGGRHPFGPSSLHSLEPAFEDIAVCGHPVKLDSANMPDGHWSFNYGCFGIHRWGGKMVTLKGFSKYVWSSEIYTRDNRYGRYQSNGSVQIYNPAGRQASGFEQEGWDWNRYPGATIIHRPLDILENPRSGTLMYSSDVQFSGSSHLHNRYGIFAVELQEAELENFDPSFAARKSMFCFDNRIICLGAGISNRSADYPSETVLFQHTWKPGSTVWMDGPEAVAELPASKVASGNDTSWLVDGHGNGYVVAAGSPVKLSVASQQSRHNKTKEPTSGDFVAAWIDHGKAPQDASYEYAILLDGTPEKTAAFAAAPPYRVIRNDAQAQIVYDNESRVLGYALFESYKGPANALLYAADQPCLIMLRAWKNALELSIGNADLRIPAMGGSYTNDEEARPGYAEIVLRGTWQLDKENADVETKVEDGRTRVVVNNIRHAIPVQLKLKAVN